MGVLSYRELGVWQKAMDFTVACYRLTGHFPRNETYGLASQLQRAAVSIPANIAEGAGRESTREYIHFASIAHGSLLEAETHVLLAERLGYLNSTQTTPVLTVAAEIGRMLRGLMASLDRKLAQSSK
jgi:four helix bundle protein